MPEVRDVIELVSVGVEILAVAVMVCYIILGTIRWLVQSLKGIRTAHEGYRLALGRTMLIGLELLVAADIIRTITVDATLKNLMILGGLIIVRTFLGWSITVEIEGRWPWQKGKKPVPAHGSGEAGDATIKAGLSDG